MKQKISISHRETSHRAMIKYNTDGSLELSETYKLALNGWGLTAVLDDSEGQGIASHNS